MLSKEMRKNKLILNSLLSPLVQFFTIASGIILPKLIIQYYGSEVNGLLASITQFLSFITFFEMGIGVVIQTSLYGPIYEGDNDKVSKIMVSAKHFFNKLLYILLVYVILLTFFLPNLINTTLDKSTIVFLIFVMSIDIFAQYYFGIINQLLIFASQNNYIYYIVQIFTVFLNLLVSVILIKLNFSILFVKLFTSLVYLIRPILLKVYVSKRFNINYSLQPAKNEISQKWNGFAQHLAYTIMSSTDIILLTLISSLENVSIYNTYNLVVNGIKLLINSISAPIQAKFGELIAKNDIKVLSNNFRKINFIISNLVSVIFSVSNIMIDDFVYLYTRNITAQNYVNPMFSFILVLSQMIFCLRLPYNSLVFAYGHYRQTQTSAITESLINIFISLLLVFKFNILGVAIGTLFAVFYRYLYINYYLYKRILNFNIGYYVKNILIPFSTFFSIYLLNMLCDFNVSNINSWIVKGIVSVIVAVFIDLIFNLIFNKKELFNLLK